MTKYVAQINAYDLVIDAVGQDSIDLIEGIGDTYTEKLAKAGIHTVADLAAADPKKVAEQTDLNKKRVES